MAELSTEPYKVLQNITPANPVGAIQAGAQAASAVLTAERQKFELGAARLGYLRDTVAGLSQKPDLSAEDVQGVVGNLVAQGIIPAKQAATMISTMGNDPKAFVNQQLKNIQSSEKKWNELYGTVSREDTGSGIQYGRVNPTEGRVPLPGALSKDLSPGEKLGSTTPVMIPGADPTTGRPTQTPGITSKVGTIFDERGNFIPKGQGQGPRELVTGAPVGEAEAIGETSRASAQDFAAARRDAAVAETTLAPLKKALPLVRKLDDNSAGVGSDQIAQVRGLLQTIGIPITENAKSQNEIREQVAKHLADNVIKVTGNADTNDRLAQTIAANPNLSMRQASIENLLIQKLALQKMAIARTRIADDPNAPVKEKDFAQFSGNFQKQVDPRAFAYDMMNPKARGALLKDLKLDAENREKTLADPNSAGAKFKRSLDLAHRTQVLEPQ